MPLPAICLSRSISLCLTLSSPLQRTPNFQSSFLYSFRPRRFRCFKPCSSLKETRKQHTLSKIPSSAPQRLRKLSNLGTKWEHDSIDRGDGDTALKGTLLAALLLVGMVGGFGTVSYLYRDQINDFLNHLSVFIEGIFK
nr:uncharacterized protein LOC109148525 [Ipomoea trifida]